MSFAGMNYLAIVIAAMIAFIFGAVYYGGLGKVWMTAARIESGQIRPRPVSFVISFICELVMAWVLAGVIGHLGVGEVTLKNGVISGFFIWLGFIATTLIVNQRYEGFGWKLTLIDGVHWLVVAVVMGAVIGALGV